MGCDNITSSVVNVFIVIVVVIFIDFSTFLSMTLPILLPLTPFPYLPPRCFTSSPSHLPPPPSPHTPSPHTPSPLPHPFSLAHFEVSRQKLGTAGVALAIVNALNLQNQNETVVKLGSQAVFEVGVWGVIILLLLLLMFLLLL